MHWIERLRVRHLQLLLALYDARSLTKAAEQMSLTQPALTKWLKEFESEIGATLFERHSRGIVPTAACEWLVARARWWVNDLARTAEGLRVRADGKRGLLRIGTTPIAMTEAMPAAIEAFQRRRPDVAVTIADDSLDVLLPWLRDGRLDLAVSLLEGSELGSDLSQQRLYAERMVVMASADHPLARLPRVSWPQALQYPWIGPSAESPVLRELQHELALANQPMPHFAVRSSSTLLIASTLPRTRMLTFFSSRTGAYFEAGGKLKVLKVPVRRTNYVGVLRLKERPPDELQEAFVRALKGR